MAFVEFIHHKIDKSNYFANNIEDSMIQLCIVSYIACRQWPKKESKQRCAQRKMCASNENWFIVHWTTRICYTSNKFTHPCYTHNFHVKWTNKCTFHLIAPVWTFWREKIRIKFDFNCTVVSIQTHRTIKLDF